MYLHWYQIFFAAVSHFQAPMQIKWAPFAETLQTQYIGCLSVHLSFAPCLSTLTDDGHLPIDSLRELYRNFYRVNSDEVLWNVDRAIAQAVSRRHPTAEACFHVQVKSCGISGGQSGNGAGFLIALRFPLPILIPPTAPDSSITPGLVQ
jgi:hypothetical protein